MFTTINADSFDSEITAEKRLVLLAYIVLGFAYKQQLETLECVSKKYIFGDSLKVCLLNEDFPKNHTDTLRLEGLQPL